MRTRSVVAGALVGAVLGAGGIAGAQDLTTSDHRTDWHVGARSVSETFLTASGEVLTEESSTQPDVGARYLVMEDLYDLDRDDNFTDKIGTGLIECTVMSWTDPDPSSFGEEGEDGDFLCVATLRFDDGSVHLQAAFSFTDEGEIRGGINSGDGWYAGADGEFVILGEDDEDADSIYELRMED